MKIIKILPALILTLILGVMVTGAVSAQQPTPSDDQVNAIAKQLYCPVCENIPLDVCPTTACAQWRELIRQKLADGWSEQQIKDYFVLQYGDRVLGTPPAKGINWLVYLVPPVAILVGVYILFRAFRSWKRPIPSDNLQPDNSEILKSSDPTQDEYISRLEEEVRKR
jgi:cytochrome c-type biogenesis protein CcmH